MHGAAGLATGRQMTLWQVPEAPPLPVLPPHHAHVETSRAAAEDAAPRQPGRRARMAAYVASCGPYGATRDDIAAALELPIQSVTGPVRELLDAGEVHETARSRPTRLGAAARVLVAPLYASQEPHP